MAAKKEKGKGDMKGVDDREPALVMMASIKDIIHHQKSGKTTVSTFAMLRNTGGDKLGTINAMLHIDDGSKGLVETILGDKVTMELPLVITVRVPHGDEERKWRESIAKEKDEAQTTLDSAPDGDDK